MDEDKLNEFNQLEVKDYKDNRFDVRKIRFLDNGRVFYDYLNYDIEVARSGFFYVQNKSKIKFYRLESGDVVFVIKETGKSYTLSFLLKLCGYS